MSYDLLLFTQQRPTEDQISAFLAQYPAASLTGTFAGRHNLLVDAESEGWFFTIDLPTPFAIEDSGLDPTDQEVLEPLAPLPLWNTFIAVPYFREEKGLQIALQFAQTLAAETEGLVWDRQTERLTSPPFAPASALPYRITLPGIDGTQMG